MAAGSGGAWKVAYADFATAMMALFIVLWLMNSDQSTKAIVAGYFRDPSGNSVGIGNGTTGPGETVSLQAQDMDRLKETLQSAMQKVPEFKGELSGQVSMMVTSEGLQSNCSRRTRASFSKRERHPDGDGHGPADGDGTGARTPAQQGGHRGAH